MRFDNLEHLEIRRSIGYGRLVDRKAQVRFSPESFMSNILGHFLRSNSGLKNKKGRISYLLPKKSIL